MEPPPEALLDQYDIYRGIGHSELHLDGRTSLLKAVLRQNKDQQFLIHRQTVQYSKETNRRLEQLKTALRSGVLQASDLVVQELSDSFTVFTIEPVRRNVEKLSVMLSESRPTKGQKSILFRNLLALIIDLHALSVPHLELSPDSIFIENQSIISLRAFHILPLSTRESSWYQSPEQVFSSRSLGSQLHCDIWSLGCIFSDLFLSLTPVFQSVEDEDRLHKLFEVMGLPGYSEVQEYISEEVYSNLRRIERTPEIRNLLSELSPEEGDYMLNMLNFDPKARPTATLLLSTFPVIEERMAPVEDGGREWGREWEKAGRDWGREAGGEGGREPAERVISNELARGPYEFYEGGGSMMSSKGSVGNQRWNFPLQTSSSELPKVRIEERPFTPEDLPIRHQPSPSLKSPVERRKEPVAPIRPYTEKPSRGVGVGVGTQEVRVPRTVGDVIIPDNQLIVSVLVGKNLL